MTTILVLYEDSRAPSGAFGPHEFFLGCVADDKGTPAHELKHRAKSCPVRGVDKLLARLKELDWLDNLIPHGGPVLAILDEDRVRERVPGSATWTSAQIADHLVRTSSCPERLTVVVLDTISSRSSRRFAAAESWSSS